jgi:hypothetical protein
MMFYKFLNERTIKLAPTPLKINGKDVFTNSEEIHNRQGYYKLESAPYPQGEKEYTPSYSIQDNVIFQSWREITAEEAVKRQAEYIEEEQI